MPTVSGATPSGFATTLTVRGCAYRGQISRHPPATGWAPATPRCLTPSASSRPPTPPPRSAWWSGAYASSEPWSGCRPSSRRRSMPRRSRRSGAPVVRFEHLVGAVVGALPAGPLDHAGRLVAPLVDLVLRHRRVLALVGGVLLDTGPPALLARPLWPCICHRSAFVRHFGSSRSVARRDTRAWRLSVLFAAVRRAWRERHKQAAVLVVGGEEVDADRLHPPRPVPDLERLVELAHAPLEHDVHRVRALAEAAQAERLDHRLSQQVALGVAGQLEDAVAGGEDPTSPVAGDHACSRRRKEVLQQLEHEPKAAALAAHRLVAQRREAVAVDGTASAVRADEVAHVRMVSMPGLEPVQAAASSASRTSAGALCASHRSASSAAMQPIPAAVTACRYVWSTTSPAANTPSTFVAVDPGFVIR